MIKKAFGYCIQMLFLYFYIVFLRMNLPFYLQTVKQHRYLMSAFYEFSTAMLRFERERVCNRVCKFIREDIILRGNVS